MEEGYLVVEAVEGLVSMAKSMADRVQKFVELAQAEKARVDRLLERDANDREAEYRRNIANAQVENGEFYNIDDTVLQPTPEWMDKAQVGGVRSYTPRGEDGTVRSVKTIRRILVTQPEYLHNHGVLDDGLFRACMWYRDRYEAAEMEPSAAVSGYGESVRGDPVYGHLPRTLWAAEARQDFRWARTFIPSDILKTFELVVLHDEGLVDAARIARCGYRNTRAAFLHGAYSLYGGISSRLVDEKRGKTTD